jgi:hypothetical protein
MEPQLFLWTMQANSATSISNLESLLKNQSKESFWGIRKVTWCDSQTLQCRQSLLCRKPLRECGCWIGTNNLLLQSQCSFSKWHSRETDSQPVVTSKETTPTCESKMAISNQNQSMAICTLQCKWHTRYMNLVLKLDTGVVSLQYHVQYDDFFETVRPSSGMNVPFHSGNTFWDLLINEQGNEPNLWRELKIRLTSPLPF